MRCGGRLAGVGWLEITLARHTLTGVLLVPQVVKQPVFLSWLTDRLILRPTQHAIRTVGERLLLPYGDHQLEVWAHRRAADASRPPSLYVLDFPGTASRAEEPGDFLDDCWADAHAVIWSVNSLGYGGSSGRASLRELAAAANHAFDQLLDVAQGTPVVVAGSSLGSVSALYLAAHRNVAGLLLQNPPDLREVILCRGGWRPIRWAARALANQIPVELSSIRNAEHATAPAVFVVAQQDEIVPTEIQQRIVDAYAGPKRVVELPDATHATKLSESDKQRLELCRRWLHDTARI